LCYNKNKDREDADERYFLWRFMVDKAHQGKGYGGRLWQKWWNFYAPCHKGLRGGAIRHTNPATMLQADFTPNLDLLKQGKL